MRGRLRIMLGLVCVREKQNAHRRFRWWTLL
jgi:hypothetical protein